MEKSDSPV